MAGRPKPLEGITVLDLTRLLPGGLCTQHLADMGAEVIKVEDTGAGDYARTLGALKTEMSPFYHSTNRNKKSVTLDLSKEEGVKLFLKMAESVDIVIEGFRPGVVDRLGVGFEAVKAVNKGIVYCSLSGYGQTGPWRLKAGHDLNYLSISGIADQVGNRGEAPPLNNFQVADLAGGTLSAAMGILAAVIDKLRTGEGRYVDISMTDCAFAHTIAPMAALSTFGKTPERGADMLTGGLPCYSIYETKDGRYMGVGSLEKKFWEMTCEAIGRPDLKPKHFVAGQEAIDVKAEVAEVFKSKTQDEWVEAFKDCDSCVTPILNLEEAMYQEQLVARDMIITVEDPADGPLRQTAFPVKFSDDDTVLKNPAPRQGEQTDEILSGLGLSDADIAALRESKVIL
ncbi:MAG: CoA transferase [Rhodospirillales bacterium]|nr:CoA transferase [Rhodospirillales bacterium]